MPCSAVQSCSTLCSPVDYSPLAPLSMEFSRQEYWSRLPFPPPGNLPDSGIKPACPALAGGSITTTTTWEGGIFITSPLFTSLSLALRKGSKHLYQCGSFQSSWPYLFATLFCCLAVHLTSQTVQDLTDSFPYLWSLYVLLPSDSCTFSCPSGSYCHSTSTKKLAVLT